MGGASGSNAYRVHPMKSLSGGAGGSQRVNESAHKGGLKRKLYGISERYQDRRWFYSNLIFVWILFSVCFMALDKQKDSDKVTDWIGIC